MKIVMRDKSIIVLFDGEESNSIIHLFTLELIHSFILFPWNSIHMDGCVCHPKKSINYSMKPSIKPFIKRFIKPFIKPLGGMGSYFNPLKHTLYSISSCNHLNTSYYIYSCKIHQLWAILSRPTHTKITIYVGDIVCLFIFMRCFTPRNIYQYF